MSNYTISVAYNGSTTNYTWDSSTDGIDISAQGVPTTAANSLTVTSNPTGARVSGTTVEGSIIKRLEMEEGPGGGGN